MPVVIGFGIGVALGLIMLILVLKLGKAGVIASIFAVAAVVGFIVAYYQGKGK